MINACRLRRYQGKEEKSKKRRTCMDDQWSNDDATCLSLWFKLAFFVLAGCPQVLIV
jgi:hypothetical protein